MHLNLERRENIMKHFFMRLFCVFVVLTMALGMDIPLQGQSKVDVEAIKKEIRNAKDELKKIGVFEKIKQAIPQLNISDKIEISKELVVFLNDSSANIRSITAVHLGELGARQYIKDIADLLDDKNILVKTGATIALGNLGATEYAQNIAGYLTNKDTGLRGAAVETLGKLGAVEYIKDITALLGDSDTSVRDKATKALVKLSELQPKKKPDDPKPGKDKEWLSDKWGFTVTLPSDWEMDILDKPEGTLVARFSDKPNGISGLITKSYFEGGADDYLKGVLEGLKEDGGLEVVVKPKGKSAATMVYICDLDEGRYQYYVRVLDVDGTKFRIVFYCSARIYNKYEDIFAQCSDTLEGTAPANKNIRVKDKIWSSEKWGFELTLPSDWQMEILEKADDITVASFSDGDNELLGFITKEPSDNSVDAYLKNILDALEKDYEAEIVRKSKGKSDATAVVIVETKNGSFQYYIRVIDSNGEKIRLVFYCAQKIYAKSEDVFLQYAGSLKGKEAAKKSADDKTWTSEKWGFELTLPSDWEMEILDKDDDGTIAYFSKEEADKLNGLITFEKSKDRADDYLKDILKSMEKDYGIEIIQAPEGKSDATAVFIGEFKTGRFQYYIRVLDDNGVKMRVVFWCKETAYNKKEGIFEKYAGTFKTIGGSSNDENDGTKVWRSGRWGFEIAFPENWTMDIFDKADGITIATFADKTGDVSGLIAYEIDDDSCDKYTEGVLKAVKKTYPTEVIVEPEGKSAATAVYVCDISGDKTVYYMHVINVAGSKLRVVFYCDKKVYNKYKPVFKSCVDSFKGW
jgi:hypothetical protein